MAFCANPPAISALTVEMVREWAEKAWAGFAPKAVVFQTMVNKVLTSLPVVHTQKSVCRVLLCNGYTKVPGTARP